MRGRRRAWTPSPKLARKILRLLFVAHREGVIELSSDHESKIRQWIFCKSLTLWARWSLADIWKVYGRTVVDWVNREAKEADEELSASLCA